LYILISGCTSLSRVVHPYRGLYILISGCTSLSQFVHPYLRLYILISGCTSLFQVVHPYLELYILISGLIVAWTGFAAAMGMSLLLWGQLIFKLLLHVDFCVNKCIRNILGYVLLYCVSLLKNNIILTPWRYSTYFASVC
jgi:hypothetical protein